MDKFKMRRAKKWQGQKKKKMIWQLHSQKINSDSITIDFISWHAKGQSMDEFLETFLTSLEITHDFLSFKASCYSGSDCFFLIFPRKKQLFL